MSSLCPFIPGYPFFCYRDGVLFVENRSVQELAQEYDTPLFIYSQAAIQAALDSYKRGFEGFDVHLHYAVKANSNLAILQFFAQQGCGFDIVSLGELQRVLTVGADPKNIVFSGVGKTRLEMRTALQCGIGCFNVESEAELVTLSEVAQASNCVAPVSLRINPDVDPKTHPYISTGLKNNKFGISYQKALPAYQLAAKLPNLEIVGIDSHIGSQISSEEPFLQALDKLLDVVAQIEASGIAIRHIDCGGGLGIDYDNNAPPPAEQLWKKMLRHAAKRGFGNRSFLVEPGRSLIGNAGICVTEVLYLKVTEGKNFCVVNAAINDLPRPAMYQAFHSIIPIRNQAKLDSCAPIYEIVGPICESGDWIGHERELLVESGDFLAVGSAGAYCMSMSSNYNSRPKAAEVLVHGSQAKLIRQRDDFAQIIAGEILP